MAKRQEDPAAPPAETAPNGGALETKPTGSVVSTTEPVGYGSDADAGFEHIAPTDLSIPFLLVLQSNSPQVTKANPQVGPWAGMLYNSVTHQTWASDKGVVIQPCHKERIYTEWLPRNAGGGEGKGFVGTHAPESDFVKQTLLAAEAEADGKVFGKLKTQEGHDLVETHLVYSQVLDDLGVAAEGFCVVGFTSTKIKPCRDWITAMYMLRVGGGRPPLFANRARFRTVQQQNQFGTFFNFLISPLKGTSWAESLIHPIQERDLLVSGRDFRDMAVKGLARANFESAAAAGDEPAGGAGQPAGRGDDPTKPPPF